MFTFCEGDSFEQWLGNELWITIDGEIDELDDDLVVLLIVVMLYKEVNRKYWIHDEVRILAKRVFDMFDTDDFKVHGRLPAHPDEVGGAIGHAAHMITWMMRDVPDEILDKILLEDENMSVRCYCRKCDEVCNYDTDDILRLADRKSREGLTRLFSCTTI